MSPGELPAMIELTSRDSMTGAPLPPQANIDARIDFDGNAATKDPSDPAAHAHAAVPGGPTTTLVLERP
jgi:hypothetical protein